MTSKEQERAALKKIQKIVDDLGDNSYLSYAFAGCFEYAEKNIDEDAAYSWKDRAESAEKSEKWLAEENENLRNEMEALKAEHSNKVKELIDERNALRRKVLPADDLVDCIQLAANAAHESGIAERRHAEEIVLNAENPSCADFRESVRNHRDAWSRKTHYEKLMDLLYSIQDRSNKQPKPD